jgi:hypothetical protein
MAITKRKKKKELTTVNERIKVTEQKSEINRKKE